MLWISFCLHTHKHSFCYGSTLECNYKCTAMVHHSAPSLSRHANLKEPFFFLFFLHICLLKQTSEPKWPSKRREFSHDHKPFCGNSNSARTSWPIVALGMNQLVNFWASKKKKKKVMQCHTAWSTTVWRGYESAKGS